MPRTSRTSCTSRTSRARHGQRAPQLGRNDWLRAARAALIDGGILAVRIGRLAQRLRVTRGSFYWHFTDHADLLRQLLESWADSNTAPFERVLRTQSGGVAQYQAIVDLWISETEYDPKLDTAVREWARVSASVAAAMRRADHRRIAILRQVFLNAGHADPDASIRARVTYFHQVGYYALGFRESRQRRRDLAPLYAAVLLGKGKSAN
jgi:AcrR family transcriptional regulator